MATNKPSRLMELLAEARARREAEAEKLAVQAIMEAQAQQAPQAPQAPEPTAPTAQPSDPITPAPGSARERLLARFAQQAPKTTAAQREVLSAVQKAQAAEEELAQTRAALSYNERQQAFIDLVSSGKSCVLIGAAGTGKTTCTRGAIQALVQSARVPIMQDPHKYLRTGTPGIIGCSFTQRAVMNLQKAVKDVMPYNIMTIHKLLEYEPVTKEIESEDGTIRRIKVFEPTRNRFRPLDSAIRVIYIDESSMVGGSPFAQDTYLLFNQLLDALPNPELVQFIFIGDLNQLPPVFGPAILGYKIAEYLSTGQVVELTEVYRQALESPILRLAHRILSGQVIPPKELETWNVPDKLTLRPWKKSVSPDTAVESMRVVFQRLYEAGSYNAESDMVLIPFNVNFGTIEINKILANMVARAEGRMTHEVVAGAYRHYFSVGDRILVDRFDAIITRIEPNPLYAGAEPQRPSRTLDYWGYNPANQLRESSHRTIDAQTVDDLLDAMASGDEDVKRAASHRITYVVNATGVEDFVDTAGEINGLLLAYALTVHKSQGSEWRRVFLLLHKSHASALNRELLYTAVTRAREELVVMCEPDSFVSGIRNQKIQGRTLLEKAEVFKGKLLETNKGVKLS